MDEQFLVLLIDDNPINAQVLEGYMAGLPVKIITARNGLEGLNLARKHLPDVILLDVLMPGLNGFEVCDEIRFNPVTGNIPVIFVTSSEEIKKNILSQPHSLPDGLLFKPINKTDLLIHIRSLMRLSATRNKMQQEIDYLQNYCRRLETTASSSLEGLTQTEEMSILLLANLAEARDLSTGEHLHRISKYVRLLSEQLLKIAPDLQQYITDSYVDSLAMAAQLHDIGKVGIPDNILNKPGRYTSKEMQIMKEHVIIGGRILNSAISLYGEKSFLSMGMKIAMYHHEKYDGTGYCEGLMSQSIPLCARIIALTDVYDAMRSKRIYKKAMSHDDVREYIADNKGKHFDPLVVESFFHHENEFKSIYDQTSG